MRARLSRPLKLPAAVLLLSVAGLARGASAEETVTFSTLVDRLQAVSLADSLLMKYRSRGSASADATTMWCQVYPLEDKPPFAWRSERTDARDGTQAHSKLDGLLQPIEGTVTHRERPDVTWRRDGGEIRLRIKGEAKEQVHAFRGPVVVGLAGVALLTRAAGTDTGRIAFTWFRPERLPAAGLDRATLTLSQVTRKGRQVTVGIVEEAGGQITLVACEPGAKHPILGVAEGQPPIKSWTGSVVRKDEDFFREHRATLRLERGERERALDDLARLKSPSPLNEAKKSTIYESLAEEALGDARRHELLSKAASAAERAAKGYWAKVQPHLEAIRTGTADAQDPMPALWSKDTAENQHRAIKLYERILSERGAGNAGRDISKIRDKVFLEAAIDYAWALYKGGTYGWAWLDRNKTLDAKGRKNLVFMLRQAGFVGATYGVDKKLLGRRMVTPFSPISRSAAAATLAVEFLDARGQTNANDLAHLGWAYIATGKWEKAYTALGRSLKLRPGAPTTRAAYGVACWKTGRTAAAREQLAILRRAGARGEAAWLSERM